MYIERLLDNEGNPMIPRELEREGISIIIEQILDDYKEVEPSDVIHMLVHSAVLLELDHDHELKNNIHDWVQENRLLIKEMFSGFDELRKDMEEILLSSFCQDLPQNREVLETLHTYYTTLWGLWLIDEIDPTDGLSWEYLDYVVERIDKENFGLIKEFIGANLCNRTSANPVQELWKKILVR